MADTGHKTKIESKAEERTTTPSLFKVLMHNDDYTTMEFVIEVLRDIFHKPSSEAEKIMLTIHFQGVGLCGTFPYAIAETKTDQVRMRARKAGFPLRCSLEEA
ncbi:ATP-dependent Clp protease adaptor protein ClpS [Malonomonas rubra DSM 5091]|uniref:ATP-dependent Clp protease adapter protein ClpS n=1 Tax=Malonomonas rubra DSM 5091 TaxID=1122189 RepID=A0A1M6EA59_MALRU|nr:ATP-dependent Clp protease adaptor ClpS [Malonomonas rubra]SHI82394.1 ATP-dependent Clp protease adaptor protein ClpS [Malonomonas rubra DSM 5091]